MSVSNLVRRHARSLIRERVCPFYFHVRGGRLYDSANPIPGVESVMVGQPSPLHCPKLVDALYGTHYPELVVEYPAAYVHRMDAQLTELSILPSGGLYFGGKQLLSAGVHPYAAMWEALSRPSVASHRHEDLIVLPWAHSWYTFGDFMDTIYPQIARIVESLSEVERQRAVYALPGLSERPWVVGYCGLLGIAAEQVVDLDAGGLASTRNGMVVTTSGLSHYSATAHPVNFDSFRNGGGSARCEEKGLKLYLQRTHGRCLAGEEDLIKELKHAGYQIVSGGLSASEQANLFAQATHIVGPHGGAFGNMLFASSCCVFEFQHPRWMFPCFRQMAQILGHSYMLTVDPSYPPSFGITHGYAQDDLNLSIGRLLEAILEC